MAMPDIAAQPPMKVLPRVRLINFVTAGTTFQSARHQACHPLLCANRQAPLAVAAGRASAVSQAVHIM